MGVAMPIVSTLNASPLPPARSPAAHAASAGRLVFAGAVPGSSRRSKMRTCPSRQPVRMRSCGGVCVCVCVCVCKCVCDNTYISTY